ncbi:hypothetical protein ZOSMA_74G00750 [Zostera marina]|uniref:Uncharacterized protein n=1 Tax=Zostera marina TaxID=29655 RepID=A0A0K9NRN5_ZOSMR|nr:hypothetical protein ZOSMA_74G00750 [Zostera marina]
MAEMGLRLGAKPTTTTVVSPSLASTTDLHFCFSRWNRSPVRQVSFGNRLQLRPPHITTTTRFFNLRAVMDGSEETETDVSSGRSDSIPDKLVDEMDFGELCNEFECISSPSVEAVARQLVRDILELRQENRALGCFAVFVKYKDPVRSFTGREKYKRPLWVTDAIENPVVTVQEMMMLSTDVLNIKWIVKGKAKGLTFADLIVNVNSVFTLNQISGQVIEHNETWDVSSSSSISQGYFWSSRGFFSANQSIKDTMDLVKKVTDNFSDEKNNQNVYPDPTGDPRKFFQTDNGLQRDVYQFALFLALIYFVIQFLKLTL